MTRITIRMQQREETPPMDLDGNGAPSPEDDADDGFGSSQEQEQPPFHEVEEPPCDDPVEALERMNAEIGRLRNERPGSALCRACEAKPDIFDDDHKRLFLHAEKNLVKAAVNRMFSYWEARADLFGDVDMLRPMNESGTLNGIDYHALERGIFQLLPQKDLMGRGLVLFDPSKHDEKMGYPTESMLRVFWYIMHVAMDDPKIRDEGFVVIVYPKRCTPEQIDRDLIVKGTAIIGTVMPLRWRGFHICHPCPSYNKYFPLVKMLAPRDMKDSIVVHFGTDDHVLQCMEKASIPADRLPTGMGGTGDVDYTKWLSDRKDSEGDRALRVAAPLPEFSSRPASTDTTMEDLPTSRGGSVSSSTLSPSLEGRMHTSKTKAKARKASAVLSSGGSVSSPSPPIPDDASSQSTAAGGKQKRPGRKGDARMHRALTLKLEDPELPLVDALKQGGFVFEGLDQGGKPHHEVFDQDNVSLMQRKNQLLRRLRVEKKKARTVDEMEG